MEPSSFCNWLGGIHLHVALYSPSEQDTGRTCPHEANIKVLIDLPCHCDWGKEPFLGLAVHALGFISMCQSCCEHGALSLVFSPVLVIQLRQVHTFTTPYLNCYSPDERGTYPPRHCYKDCSLCPSLFPCHPSCGILLSSFLCCCTEDELLLFALKTLRSIHPDSLSPCWCLSHLNLSICLLKLFSFMGRVQVIQIDYWRVAAAYKYVWNCNVLYYIKACVSTREPSENSTCLCKL